MTIETALEAIYESLRNDNHELDLCIRNLKAAMTEAGAKSVTVDPAKLAQNNRQGRKLMQSYFRQKGVAIEFAKG